MLREDNDHKRHKYLCSNPNCRKVFSRPKIITYKVCPACQTLVNVSETENQGETPISFTSKPVKPEKQKNVETKKSEGLTLEVQTANVEPPMKESSASEKKPETISLEKVQIPQQQQEKGEIPPVQHTKTLEAETVSQSSSNCRFGFGYLGRRKKSEQIPDACIECPKSLNCMLSDYYKQEESVAEIKKWYAP